MAETRSIRTIALDLFSCLYARFPVCCASDEFIFFPQAVSDAPDWSVWDDLSRESVKEAVHNLRRFGSDVSALTVSGKPAADPSLSSLLTRAARNLEEQFTLVRTHATQPTFALTIVTAGLVEALRSGVPEALPDRLRTLPRFLDTAMGALADIPALYRDLGVEMAEEVEEWLRSLGSDRIPADVFRALRRYRDGLSRLTVVDDFHLPPEIFEKVVTDHTGSGLSIGDALEELEDEAAAVLGELQREAAGLDPGRDWDSCFKAIEGDPVPSGGRTGLLGREVDRLREHCRRWGFLAAAGAGSGRLEIEQLPDSLAPVRAADSYNALPGHPFRGGVFSIFGGGHLGSGSGPVHPVYRMTAAHETFPGHHLLDSCRWNNPEAVLRPMEYPLFYEGWACFGEDLMLLTGAFDRPYDRLMLLRRRHRHAVRGKADLLLHSGRIGLAAAAGELVSAGFPVGRARKTVRKYALRPAYQMCYTIGRRRFQRLFESHCRGDERGFVNTVLSSGELLFEDLERTLKSAGGGEGERG